MKGFLKHLVFFFFGLIIFLALFEAGSSNSNATSIASDNILILEDALAGGQIVNDGMMDEDETLQEPNTIGQGANAVGNTIVGALASFIELVGESLYNFFA